MPLDKYVYRNGKKLKYGYTTGTCAAAATKAAVKTLMSGETHTHVSLEVPKGWVLDLPVETTEINEFSVKTCIKKDAGDDSDVTDGLLICSTVTYSDETIITGGEGVGTVTKAGLPVAIGQAAINPVPQQMIQKVLDAYSEQPLSVEISVPEGEAVAQRTFNPQLGITGGISIIGTSGIVEPMSLKALKDSLVIEFNQMKDFLEESIILVPGNYGRDYVRALNIADYYSLKISNYVGFFLDRLVENNFKKVLMVGHIGKLIKIAAGNFNTHSKISDARLETLIAHAALLGADQNLLKKAYEEITTDGALNHLLKGVDPKVYCQTIVSKIKEKMEQHVYGDLTVEVIMFSNQHGFLGETAGAQQLIKDDFNG